MQGLRLRCLVRIPGLASSIPQHDRASREEQQCGSGDE